MRNARHAYSLCQSDWLLHCDADEFVWTQEQLGDYLSEVDDETDCCALSVAERISAPDMQPTFLTGAFRRPFPGKKAQGRATFGKDYDLTNRGLTGHTQGKCFVRTGRDLRLSIHRPKAALADDGPTVKRIAPDTVELLHFEGLTTRHWIFKMMRMADAFANHDGMPPAPHRKRQVAALLADPAEADALHDRLKQPDYAALAELGLLQRPPFDVTQALATYFPGEAIDLTNASVDLWLSEHKQGITALMHGGQRPQP
ncbi:hypothetical protein DFP92_103252 [Yoonia sediminilitoris]|uniref:Glycosyl transferase family 2 n=2 Tax=Yoonia sediminilitoris TaxID=1286148 RepID=A0A2T6KKA4_9RHOB|nr:hypothetical protein C8N45_103252 [Yoonia sediminilitoris]RCW96746.1 hypothetical protein DFP92_103252 [Yoonia sediminilitoris]